MTSGRHFARVYWPSTWQVSPSPPGVLVYVPSPLIPFSLPLPTVNPHLPFASTGAPSFVSPVPWNQTKNLSPLSMVATWKPRAREELPLMSAVSVLTPSLDLSPPISIGLVQAHLNCSTRDCGRGGHLREAPG